jgi:alpha-mannosidase
VPAQKWADLSQRDYGVALLNDCKYGYKVKGNVLDLHLLRSVVYPRQPLEPPDSEREAGAPCFGFTDQCEHEFTYSLLPHAGAKTDTFCLCLSRACLQANHRFSM